MEKTNNLNRPRRQTAQPSKAGAPKPAPTVNAITKNIDINTARNAIILSEIIGPPLTKRRSQKWY